MPASKNPNTPPEGQSPSVQTAEPVTLDRIIEKMTRSQSPDDKQKKRAQELLKEFKDVFTATPITEETNIVEALKMSIAEKDKEISRQLDVVMHDPELQRLEAAWRGLHFLVMNTTTSTMLKLRLLNAKRDEIGKDLKQAVEFDQSFLFKQLYEAEYGTFGGTPYSVLIGDYHFGRSDSEMDWLTKMSQVASAAHAPFIASADPALFDMDSFADLQKPRDLAKIFESTEMIKWKSFRDTEDSRYVALVLPQFLLRLPYGQKTNPVEEFDYEEDVFERGEERTVLRADGTPEKNPDGTDKKERPIQHEKHDLYLWGNSAYALGQRITNAFHQYKWTAAIRGVEGGGVVEDLQLHNFETGEKLKVSMCPTEVSITDRREKELNDLGFISLVHCKNSDKAAFFGGQTVQKPVVYNTPQATANARVSSQLPYILAASRFAHYLKSIMRDKIGSFMTRENVEKYLNTWIADYVLLNDNASQSSKASYPLREARVDVFDIPGKPGCYRATVFLRPHFQLEELTASIRLVAELPPPAAA
jgi:type VI secretion system protein ImpC